MSIINIGGKALIKSYANIPGLQYVERSLISIVASLYSSNKLKRIVTNKEIKIQKYEFINNLPSCEFNIKNKNFQQIHDDFMAGNSNINSYLSKHRHNVDRFDYIREIYGIHHFHLQIKGNGKEVFFAYVDELNAKIYILSYFNEHPKTIDFKKITKILNKWNFYYKENFDSLYYDISKSDSFYKLIIDYDYNEIAKSYGFLNPNEIKNDHDFDPNSKKFLRTCVPIKLDDDKIILPLYFNLQNENNDIPCFVSAARDHLS